MTENKKPKAMRDALIGCIYEKMKEDNRIFLVSADLGAPALDQLRSDFKDRFINVGIAEQNLVNVASGLALEGNIVYAYAIAPFLTMRACEQIRQNLSISSQIKPINVNLIGIGAGLSYGLSGAPHYCFEDISIMRLMPNISVFSPSDCILVEEFFNHSLEFNMPKYLRLDGEILPLIYEDVRDLDFKKGFYELIKGKDVCLVSTGYMTHTALKVANKSEGVGVIDVFTLKKTDEASLAETLKKYKKVITIEEAFINNGGLDSLILGVINRNNLNIEFRNLGFNDRHIFELGGREYVHKLNNLDDEGIINEIKKS